MLPYQFYHKHFPITLRKTLCENLFLTERSQQQIALCFKISPTSRASIGSNQQMDSSPQMNSKAHKPKLELEITSPKPQKTGSSHKNLWHEESTYCIPNLKLDWLTVDCNHACPKFHANSQIMNRLKPLICKL
jgi:hypothetical protein